MKRISIVLLALLFATPLQAETVQSGRFLFRVVAESEPHRNALTALVRGRRDVPGWVRLMISRDGYVALASEAVEVEGRPMELFRACDARNCPDSEIRVLFSPDGKHVTMLVRDKDRGVTELGEPSEAERAVLSSSL